MESIGLRYFNVFGPRQNPAGPYAAVIPLWFQAMVEKKPIFINGDGTTSRDFCFVANVVQANLLAATSTNAGAAGQCYNIACGDRTSLNQLAELIGRAVSKHGQQGVMQPELVYRDFRPGDVAHSHANIEKATVLLGYSPRFGIKQGLDFTAEWFFSQQH
jgi:UDP-N-acetylglucosamine 4-epimerase